MGQQPKRRSDLGEDPRCQAAQARYLIADIARKHCKAQSGQRSITQRGKRVDATGEVRGSQILAHPARHHRACQCIVEPDPIMCQQFLVVAPREISA